MPSLRIITILVFVTISSLHVKCDGEDQRAKRSEEEENMIDDGTYNNLMRTLQDIEDARDLKNYGSLGGLPNADDDFPFHASELKAKYDPMLQLFSNLLGKEEDETTRMTNFENPDSLNEQLNKLAEVLDFYKSNDDSQKEALLSARSSNQDPNYYFEKNGIKNVDGVADQASQLEQQIKSKKLGSPSLISPFKKSSNVLLSSPFKKSYFLQSPFKKSADEEEPRMAYLDSLVK